METGPFSNLNRLSVVWRRKWLVLATIVVVIGATYAVSKSLTPIYSTSSTLIIAQPGRQQTFDTAQANEEAARSYSQILSGTNFAGQVAHAVGGGLSASKVTSETTIQSVANTQLIKITAEDASRRRAKAIADTYASVFVAYAPRLTPQTKATITLADYAPLPKSAVRPKPSLYALVAAILGVMAGIGLAFLRERFDVRLRTVEDVAAHTELPILGDIPVRSKRSMEAFAESFRLLRTTLRFIDQSKPTRSIAIVSWGEGEGKTTVASQLALTLSVSDTRTLVVDGDMVRPGLQPLLLPGIEDPLEPGLSDYVLDAARLHDCLYHASKVPSLQFMPAGRQVPNLSSLLQNRRGRNSFTELQHVAETTIVDCPPLAVGADALTIAAQVDGVILIVDSRHATNATLANATRRLEQVKATTLGIVVNRDRSLPSTTYYTERYRENGAVVGGGVLERARRTLTRSR